MMNIIISTISHSARQLGITWKTASTLAIHISLIFGVAAYTLFGAFVMQYLESPTRIASLKRRETESDGVNIIEKISRVYLGNEVSQADPNVHNCIQYAIKQILDGTKCKQIDHISIANIDRCYQNANLDKILDIREIPRRSMQDISDIATTQQVPNTIEEEIQMELDKWSFGNSLIFAFTVITTIGYGHVAPVTFSGRLFFIIYGVFGVPLTLLTIADMGMFFTKILKYLTQLILSIPFYFTRCYHICKRKKKNNEKNRKSEKSIGKEVEKTLCENKKEEEAEKDEEGEEEEDNESLTKNIESLLLGILFIAYLFLGAKVLSVYEPEMDFFKALYFNFVTLTTIGLGDFVPKSFDYLFLTLCYIGIGLSLTTMAIEIAADLLKKVHYVGRKMENMGNAVVWFGGKKMTMKSLMKNLGDQFNIPEEELAAFNLDQFVDNAIKVEAGEIKTLRKPVSEVVYREPRAVSYSHLRQSNQSTDLNYVDERMSRITDIYGTDRTVDTLPILHKEESTSSRVPKLDLDYQFLTDSSMPTSFDQDYLKTMSTYSKRFY